MSDPRSIVCLGWGSLIWDPDSLPIKQTDPLEKAWLLDGPLLPVEFARHSGGNRITLVLVPGLRTVPVLWTPMLLPDLETAKRSLAMRECRRRNGQPVSEDAVQRFLNESCGYWTGKDSKGNCADLVGQWAAPRNLLAVIWTDFPARFNGIDGQTPTSEQVIEFLRHRSGQERQDAMNYITRAPRQISTYYRDEIEAELEWYPTSIV